MKRISVSIVLLSSVLSFGQTDIGHPNLQKQLDLNPFLSINLGNLAVSIHAPVRSKQIGPLPIDATMALSILPYVNSSSNYDNTSRLPVNVGTQYAQGSPVWYQTGPTQTCNGNPNDTYTYFQGIIDQFGTFHTLKAELDDVGCASNGSGVALDGSGYTVQLTSLSTATICSAGGNCASYTLSSNNTPAYQSINDPHNNVLTMSEGASAPYTVTMDDPTYSTHPFLQFNDPSKQSAGTSTQVTYWDATPTARHVTATYTAATYNPQYSCPGATNGQSTQYFLTNISYPDGSSIGFGWEQKNSKYTGRLASITLPQGGAYNFTYSGGTYGDGIWCNGSNAALDGISNATIQIATTPATGTWTLSRSWISYLDGTSQTVATKPDGSVSTVSFSSDYPTREVDTDTDGVTVLKTIYVCTSGTYPCPVQEDNPYFTLSYATIIKTYVVTPGVNKADLTGGACSLSGCPLETDISYDGYGNVIEVDKSGYGPVLLSKEVHTYGSWNGSSCVAVGTNVFDRTCDSTISDGSGNVVSHSRFTYNSKGDLLYAYRYPSSGGNPLTTAMTYNANGTRASVASPNGYYASFSYANHQCNGFMPDSVADGTGTQSTTWDCNGGVVKTTTDYNGLVTTYTYADPLYRVTQIADNGGNAPTVVAYPSANQSERSITFNTNASISDTVTNLDSFGRVLSVQHEKAPSSSSYDTIGYTYDTTGRRKSVRQACTTSRGGSCTTDAITYAYDGLNRLKVQTTLTSPNGVLSYTYPSGDVNIVLSPAPSGEHTKTVQVEKDGLGRTVSVCTVTSLPGSGSCGQRSGASGYLTQYTLDPVGRTTQISRNAQAGGTTVNTNFVLDLLGRVTQSQTPESNRTVAYAYFDTVTSACSSYASNNHVTLTVNPSELAQTSDPAGNVVCYSYDSLGRLNSIYPASGPNLSVTPARFFCYDGNCNATGSNLKGRISDMGTVYPPFTGDNTDDPLGYDIYGRPTDVWQMSPSTGGQYFHTTASYWDNGVLKTLGGIPGVSSFSYIPDGEGRPNSASAGATSIVSSVSYDSASKPTTITYADGDTDNYLYDANTQNTTQYQFTLGSTSTTDTGVLGWNPNGTLGSLAITDNISSSDSGTCSAGHDDLSRIVSYNCGSPFTESYSYSGDYAGNVTKSGSLSFVPGYNPANNHMLSPYTYDAKGFLLHDSTLNQDYTWDALGGMASVAGNSLVSDALGRAVEKPGAFLLYGPTGKLGTLASLTGPLSIRMPLPGGSSITYDNAGNQQLNRKDWAGSTRLVSNRVARTLVTIFAYGPMGELYVGSGGQYESTYQDTSPGLYDNPSFHHSGAQGRTIEPKGGANGYVKNNNPF